MLLAVTLLCALAGADAAPAPVATPPTPAPVPAPAPGTPPATTRRVKAIVLDLKGAALTADERRALATLITVSLAHLSALDVVSGADVRELIALEGEKQAVGCEQDMACLAELGGALGARLVVYGSVDKLGSILLLTVTLHDTRSGAPAGRTSVQAGDVDGLARALPDAVREMAVAFLRGERLSTAGSASTSSRVATGGIAIDTAFVGGVVALAGTAVFLTTYVGTMAVGANNRDQQEVLEQLKVPVFGKLEGARLIEEEKAGASPGLYGAAAVEALGAAAAVGGAATFTVGRVVDGPALDGPGNAWRWGFIGGGVLLGLGGVALDITAATSTDRTFGLEDLAPVALEMAGVGTALVGLLANPFEDSGP